MQWIGLLTLLVLSALATPAVAQCTNGDGEVVAEGELDPLNACALCRGQDFDYLPERTACTQERRVFCAAQFYRVECVANGAITTCEQNPRFDACPNGLRCDGEFCLTVCNGDVDCRPDWTCAENGTCEPPPEPDMGVPDMGVPDMGAVDMGRTEDGGLADMPGNDLGGGPFEDTGTTRPRSGSGEPDSGCCATINESPRNGAGWVMWMIIAGLLMRRRHD